MKKEKTLNYIKELSVQIMWEVIGSIFIAIGIVNFAVHAEFPMTGFSGISIILYRLFNVPIGFSTILMNIPLAIVCYRLLGRKFFISSIRCMLISSVFIDYVAPLFPYYEGSRLLAALCTGVFAGIGYALIYIRNSSTGGADFVVMAIKAKNPHLAMGNIIFASDMAIILIGGFIFRDVDGIIYGAIVSFIFSIAVDKIMYGKNAGKVAFIVTDHARELCKIIDDCCQRGTTVLRANGGYKGDEKGVVMCASNSKEMYDLRRKVKEADPQSFFIIVESHEVHGEGFKMVQIGETEHT
ncbi:MAG: YitT family protein [Clostridia bacterium]|nr:YitT family protein [Clostridia bacterium]